MKQKYINSSCRTIKVEQKIYECENTRWSVSPTLSPLKKRISNLLLPLWFWWVSFCLVWSKRLSPIHAPWKMHPFQTFGVYKVSSLNGDCYHKFIVLTLKFLIDFTNAVSNLDHVLSFLSQLSPSITDYTRIQRLVPSALSKFKLCYLNVIVLSLCPVDDP